MNTARIAIVEDHLLQRTRTEELLRRAGAYEIVFSGESAPDFTRWAEATPRSGRPHLLLLDLMVDRRPSVSPAQVEVMVKAGLKVLVLSALASPTLVRQVVRAGVSGVVGKRDSEADILAAIAAVLSGAEWMTPELASVIAGDPDRPALSVQEERALVLYASGLSVDEIGAAMNIGRATAKQYLDRVKKKYASVGVPVRSKLDYGRVAWADGYLDPSLPSDG
ncbi:response regulator transcription factor [Leucobacter luti]|uniref:LuxR family two component transcriptional regulator n=1 Tax=Leucobacter luti TaxID=340320 RepID=A0A4Q7TPH1_9MICO|nr:response regulator transcription factor [Leucobacter luti]MBL3699989.1 DNA-binding response regulator [Leucobacter luti]RZT62695.1 LuxR family two component transcriptional regulator [Leucobacter luti]